MEMGYNVLDLVAESRYVRLAVLLICASWRDLQVSTKPRALTTRDMHLLSAKQVPHFPNPRPPILLDVRLTNFSHYTLPKRVNGGVNRPIFTPFVHLLHFHVKDIHDPTRAGQTAQEGLSGLAVFYDSQPLHAAREREERQLARRNASATRQRSRKRRSTAAASASDHAARGINPRTGRTPTGWPRGLLVSRFHPERGRGWHGAGLGVCTRGVCVIV